MSIEKKPVKRSSVYEEGYKKGAVWPHGKEQLMQIINQEGVNIEFQKAGTNNDQTEYVVLKIDGIDPNPFIKKLLYEYRSKK